MLLDLSINVGISSSVVPKPYGGSSITVYYVLFFDSGHPIMGKIF